MDKNGLKNKFLVFSWALYDLANQFFTLNIISLYFPRWLTFEKNAPEILYSLTFGASIFLVAVCSPILGTISDVRAKRRSFLIYFTLLSIVFTLLLGVSTNIFLGLIFFAIANFGCQGAIVFYNALMVNVAPTQKAGLISGLGKMFGYIGGILAIYLSKPLFLKFGYQAVFFLSGSAFLIFSLPCMIFVKDYSQPLQSQEQFSPLSPRSIKQIFRRLKATISDSYKLFEFRLLLKAAFFSLCMVNTVLLFMAVYVSKVFGLTEVELINLTAFSTFFAILGSIASGIISDKFGGRRSLLGIFFLWGICILSAGLLGPPFHWAIGALAGISLGSTWVVLRAVTIRIVPSQKVGEAFGLFNLVGHLSGIIGPIWWGLVLLRLKPLGQLGYRAALLSLVFFLFIGLAFILRMVEHRE